MSNPSSRNPPFPAGSEPSRSEPTAFDPSAHGPISPAPTPPAPTPPEPTPPEPTPPASASPAPTQPATLQSTPTPPTDPRPDARQQPPAAARRGPEIAGFTPPPAPGPARIEGRHVTLERLDPAAHAAGLFAANQGHDALWTYLGYGPFADAAAYAAWQASVAPGSDPLFYALRDRASGRVGGVAAFLRIDTTHGVIEIGHIQIAPFLQRSTAASEAIMRMIGWAFAAGYRRVEWKCDALNAPSMRAAARYGFTPEGVFRQHMVVKGRNRDTAWWAITDADWPALERAYAAWLAPGNVGPDGGQLAALGTLIARQRGGDRS